MSKVNVHEHWVLVIQKYTQSVTSISAGIYICCPKFVVDSNFQTTNFWNFTSLKILLAFKCPIGGVGAPMPILDSYTSSYKHIFIWNTSKLHFLYPTKLVEYEYVKKNVKKIFQYFSEKKKPIFLALELQCQFLSLISALTATFLVKMPASCTFCIQLN